MKLNYYAETDSLYIDLSEKSGIDSREVSEGVVPDYDKDGNLVGIDIDNARNYAVVADPVVRRGRPKCRGNVMDKATANYRGRTGGMLRKPDRPVLESPVCGGEATDGSV